MGESPAAASVSKSESSKGGRDQLLSIGQLVKELQSDFPELSISKVRYLEDRGLLTPQRTKGRYRKYTKADVRRLRGILTMQRDEYLPLDVIRRRVDSGDPGILEASASPMASVASWSSTLQRQEPVYTLEELCEELGVDEEYVLSLVEFRLVERMAESGPAFTEGDLETARICRRLGHYHVEPRHLRMLSSAAEREAGLIEQVATPDLRSGHQDRREHGLQTTQDLTSLFDQLTRLLMLRELRHIL